MEELLADKMHEISVNAIATLPEAIKEINACILFAAQRGQFEYNWLMNDEYRQFQDGIKIHYLQEGFKVNIQSLGIIFTW